MPAEWEPHLASYIIWPHNPETWPGRFAEIAPAFAQLAAAISAFEPVRVVVQPGADLQAIRQMIAEAAPAGIPAKPERVEFAEIPSDDSWVRDTGPVFVNCANAPGQLALAWRFNAWGGKYPDFADDAALAARLAARWGVEAVRLDPVLEGGAIEVDGEGSLLATESCLLNPNRNPGLDRAALESYLHSALGARKVLWLAGGIRGDDTDGHVDEVARFIGPGRVAAAYTDDPRDPNYGVLAENLARLCAMTDARGRQLAVVRLPMPHPAEGEGQPPPASYANFYFVNGGVLMPAFGCPQDAQARALLEGALPGRRVVEIAATDLALGLGGIHCLTQQHPAPAA